MRRVLFACLIVFAFLLVAAGAALWFVDINRYHGRIQAELETSFKRKIQLGKMRISFLPLGFRVDRLEIAEDARFDTSRPFAQAQELNIAPQFWPLLHGDVQINSFSILNPQIELVRNQAGEWNFSSLGQTPSRPENAGQPSAVPESAAQPSPGVEPKAYSLAELRIENGQVALTDLQTGTPRAVYDHIDLTVKGYAPGRPFDITAAAHLPGEGTQTIAVDARMGPVNNGHLVATPLDGKLQVSQVSLSSLNKFLNVGMLAGTDGVATGEARIKNADAKLTSSGSLSLEHVRLNGTDFGYPLSAQFDLLDDLEGKVLTIQKGALTLGSTPLSATGVVDMKPTPFHLDLAVKTSNASIEGISRLLAALKVTIQPGMKVDGRLTADVRAQGEANQPALNGTLAVQDLEVSGKGLPEPIKVNSIQLALTPQAIHSNNFSASTGKTRVDAQFTLSGYTTPNPVIDLGLQTGDAKVEDLLNMATAYGVSAVEGMSGTGNANLNLHASGALKNAAALNFSGDGLLRNASLRLPQLTKPLDVHNANLRFTRNSVVLENLAFTLNQTNATGTLTVQNFSAPQLQFTLTADKVDVADIERMFAGGPASRGPATSWDWSLITSAEAAAKNGNWLSKATGTGKVSIDTVVYDQLLLSRVRTNVALDRGAIRLAPLTADLFDGQESGSATIDMRQEPVLYTVSSDIKNVDANKLLSAISSVKDQVFGPFTGNVNVTFRAAPSAQIARTLNGAVSLELKNGRLAGFNFLKELGALGQFTNVFNTAKSFTEVTQLSAKFKIKEGVAQTDDLKGVFDSGTLAGTGTISLVDQSLNMNLTAVLSGETSQSVEGNGIGGLLSTVLANNKGELIMPVIVTGTLQHPKFTPDAGKIAQMKLQGILPTADNPKSLDDLLNSIFRKPKKDKP